MNCSIYLNVTRTGMVSTQGVTLSSPPRGNKRSQPPGWKQSKGSLVSLGARGAPQLEVGEFAPFLLWLEVEALIRLLISALNALVAFSEAATQLLVALRKKLKSTLRGPQRRTTVGNRPAQQESHYSIPPQVFQTAASKSLDEEHAERIQTLRDLNPALTFRVWDDQEIHEYMARSWRNHEIVKIFEAAKFGAVRADIFRYCILSERGGYYLDINKSPECSIQSLHSCSAKAFLTFDRDDTITFPPIDVAARLEYPHKLIAQWGMGFVAGHPIPSRAIERIVDLYPFFRGKKFHVVRDAVFSFTGPGMFTDVVHQFLEETSSTGIEFAGRMFGGRVVSRMPGSHRSAKYKAHYTSARDQVIVD